MPSPVTAHSPVAVELSSDSSTSSKGGAPSMLRHTVPLPFIGDPEASSLSTSINGFRLDDHTTKSMTASNWTPSHHSQGSKIDARFFSTSSGRESFNLSGCERRTLQALHSQLYDTLRQSFCERSRSTLSYYNWFAEECLV